MGNRGQGRKKSYEAAQAEFKTAIAKYNPKLKKAKDEEEKRKIAATDAYEKAQTEIDSMKIPLRKTKQLLRKLYSADVVYPKYRNMVAMCTIYEYLASGRCETLDGAQGAYNLYEAEIRQNIVISN